MQIENELVFYPSWAFIVFFVVGFVFFQVLQWIVYNWSVSKLFIKRISITLGNNPKKGPLKVSKTFSICMGCIYGFSGALNTVWYIQENPFFA